MANKISFNRKMYESVSLSQNVDSSEKRKKELSVLDFFLPFIQSNGHSYPDVCRVLGLTRQVSTYWRKVDDIRLSNIFRYAELTGYRVDIRLVKSGMEFGAPVTITSSGVTMHSDGSISFKKLFFLKAAMKRDGIRIKDLAEVDGCCQAAISKMFDADDMMLSKLVGYARAFDWSIKFHYIPTNNDVVHNRKAVIQIDRYIEKEF